MSRLKQSYKSRSRSSAVRFACLRMDLKAPLASSRCIGTITESAARKPMIFRGGMNCVQEGTFILPSCLSSGARDCGSERVARMGLRLGKHG